jgi:hypothetical protein
MIRRARNTDNAPAAGSQAIATMMKSNMFQPSRAERER